MTTLPRLYPTGDGTATTMTAPTGAATYWQAVDDLASGAHDSDTTYITAGLDVAGSVFLLLTDMPSDFASIDTLSVSAIVKLQGTITDDTTQLWAQVFAADETTALTSEVMVCDQSTGGTYTVDTTAMTGLTNTTSKTLWDGARLRLRWVFTKNMASDGIALRVTAAYLDGTYTQAVPVAVAAGRFGLAAQTPSERTNHTLTVNARSTQGGGTLTYALYEGATLRASFDAALTSTLTEYTGVLSQAQMDAITNYSLLELRLSAAKSNGPMTVEVAEVFFTAPSPSTASLTGTLAGDLPALTGALAATLTVRDAYPTNYSAVWTLPALTGAFSGAGAVTGVLAADLPALQADLSAAAAVTGALAADLPSLQGDVAASASASAVITGTLPALQASAAATATVGGVLAADLPALTGTAAGAASIGGTLAGMLPALTASLSGASAGGNGTLNAQLPALTGTASGNVRVTGTLNAQLPALTADAAADVQVSGQVAGQLPALTAAFVGAVQAASGVLAAQLPTLTATASGRSTLVSTLAAALPGLLASLSGAAYVDLPPQVREGIVTVTGGLRGRVTLAVTPLALVTPQATPAGQVLVTALVGLATPDASSPASVSLTGSTTSTVIVVSDGPGTVTISRE